LETTPYKGSDKCQGHTCENWECKNAKSFDDLKYCKKCRCCVPNCNEKKSYDSEEACYKHYCTRCHKKAFSSHNDEKLCDICVKQCNDCFCKNQRVKNGKFCLNHTCDIDNCKNRKFNNNYGSRNEKYCRKLHGCLRCYEFRGESDDSQYCMKCLNKCFYYKKCDQQRPETHLGRFYYCNDHGCLECNN
jgi:hypothetical protein